MNSAILGGGKAGDAVLSAVLAHEGSHAYGEKLGKQKFDAATINRIEKGLGLNLKQAERNDYMRITQIKDFMNKNPRIPTKGNEYFKFAEGLPGGGPELVIDSIPTGRR